MHVDQNLDVSVVYSYVHNLSKLCPGYFTKILLGAFKAINSNGLLYKIT